ncbi:MAG: hypothetical protein PHE84_09145 [bacterium]|nr:hypothetical protein [bacterium]
MKHLLVAGVLLFALTIVPAAAGAQTPVQNGFSLGVVLGDPTGFTLRAGFGERNAVQAHFGFGFFPGDSMVAMVDWTHDTGGDLLRDNPTALLRFYFGVGGKAEWFTGRYYAYRPSREYSFYNDQSYAGFGARGLVGLRLSFREAPIDLFLELAPVGVIFLVPDPAAFYDPDFALGVRFRF